jgi:hypothetical protein
MKNESDLYLLPNIIARILVKIMSFYLFNCVKNKKSKYIRKKYKKIDII